MHMREQSPYKHNDNARLQGLCLDVIAGARSLATALNLLYTIRPYMAFIHVSSTIESHTYAPLFCMLALGKTGEGAYVRDCDVSA